MKKLIALLVVALSSVTLHAQGVWTQENIDPDTGLRTGVIEVNGNTYPIGPNGPFLWFASLNGADLSNANLSGADLNGATFTNNLEDVYLGTLLSAVSKGNYDEIQALKPQVETNTTEIAELKTMMEAMSVQMQQLNARLDDQQASIAERDQQIAELSQRPTIGQLLQLNAILDNRQASIEERDQQIAELSQRPTLEEVQDARPGSLVFRADEATNSVTLEFEIQSSENLQDWVAQPETVTATVPLDAEKKFIRIALAQE